MCKLRIETVFRDRFVKLQKQNLVDKVGAPWFRVVPEHLLVPAIGHPSRVSLNFNRRNKMEATKAYVITWVCLFITYLILKWPKKLLRPALDPCIRLLPRFIQKWPRYFKIHRRTLYSWNSQRVTLTHYIICFVYLVGNVLLFVRPTFKKGVAIVKTDSDERQRRAAVAGLTNLVPVIFGGRTCFLADAFNIPLQQYYFAHHWLARLAVIEITVHVIAQTHGGLVWTGHAAVGLTVQAPRNHLHILTRHRPSFCSCSWEYLQ